MMQRQKIENGARGSIKLYLYASDGGQILVDINFFSNSRSIGFDRAVQLSTE